MPKIALRDDGLQVIPEKNLPTSFFIITKMLHGRKTLHNFARFFPERGEEGLFINYQLNFLHDG